MVKKQSKLLSDFLWKLDPKQRLAVYFSGTVNQCLLLKRLLEETKNEILVYFFDLNKLRQEDIAAGARHDKNLKILAHFKKKRDFALQEIEIANLTQQFEAKNLDEAFLHIKLLKEINSRIFADAFVLSDDLSFFSNQIKVMELFSSFEKQDTSLELLTPFSNLTPQEISSEALSGALNQFDEINFDKLYSQNKAFIDSLKSFDEKKDKKEEKLDNLIGNFTCYDAIFYNLLTKQKLDDYILFTKFYADLISKDFIVYALSNLITFKPYQETLITHLVEIGGLSDKQVNQALFGLVNRYSYYREATKSMADEVDYFLRLYDYKITEETKDRLMWKIYSVRIIDFYNQPILEKLISWGCDVGDLLLKSIDSFGNDKKELCATTLLENYKNKITNLQLNEALLKAFDSKLYNLCKTLIAAGADKKIIQFHSYSYGWALWVRNRNKEIKTDRNYWQKKDRVIIHEILKELGNPQDKVPPVIHVTGSNGKGSTCAFLRSILESNGYSVHVLTSPSIVRNNENRIIAGKEILDQQYYDYLIRAEAAFHKIKDREDFKEKIAQANKEDGLTEDQIKEDHYLNWSFIIPAITTAFAENKADALIVEVVTGGEFDVTNIFSEKNTVATIINSIIFGDNHAGTFGSIEGAAETKSRLAKNGIPLLSVAQEEAVEKVIRKVADDKGCPLYFAGQDFVTQELDDSYFSYKGWGKEFRLQKPKLAGGFQIHNAAISLSALLASKKFNLQEAKISSAIANAYHTARFMEIDNFKVEGYERVWFGTDKFRSSANSYSFSKECDLIQTITGNSDDYIGGDIKNSLTNFGKVMFVNLDPAKDKVLYSKISDLIFSNKKHLSSAISYLSKKQVKTADRKNLVIKTTGISSFPKNYLQLLEQLNQSGFLPDLEFAKQHKLLDEDLVSLIS